MSKRLRRVLITYELVSYFKPRPRPLWRAATTLSALCLSSLSVQRHALPKPGLSVLPPKFTLCQLLRCGRIVLRTRSWGDLAWHRRRSRAQRSGHERCPQPRPRTRQTTLLASCSLEPSFGGRRSVREGASLRRTPSAAAHLCHGRVPGLPSSIVHLDAEAISRRRAACRNSRASEFDGDATTSGRTSWRWGRRPSRTRLRWRAARGSI